MALCVVLCCSVRAFLQIFGVKKLNMLTTIENHFLCNGAVSSTVFSVRSKLIGTECKQWKKEDDHAHISGWQIFYWKKWFGGEQCSITKSWLCLCIGMKVPMGHDRNESDEIAWFFYRKQPLDGKCIFPQFEQFRLSERTSCCVEVQRRNSQNPIANIFTAI